MTMNIPRLPTALSIHDLTRRSTYMLDNLETEYNFQFTTSQGGRRISVFLLCQYKSFNSRPHKEVDLDY